MEVKQPAVKITYNSTDVTLDFTRLLQSFSYEDAATGYMDTVTLKMVNDARFNMAWYPDPGDKLLIQFGYVGALVDAGEFEIDEIEFSGLPDVVTLKATATPYTRSLRTLNSRSFENLTLQAIVARVAADNQVSMSGSVDDSVVIPRVTQLREDDLQFLARICREYGYGFSCRATTFNFFKFEDLESVAPGIVLTRKDILSYRLTDKTKRTYRRAVLAHRDPGARELITQSSDANAVATQDELKLYASAKSTAEALLKTRAALYLANTKKVSGAISVPGNPRFTAGLNVTVQDLGALNGTYHILSSRHTITATGGYVTDIQIKRVTNEN